MVTFSDEHKAAMSLYVSQRMRDIERVLGPNYVLTITARCINETLTDADIVITAERDLDMALMALARIAAQDKPIQ